MDTAMFLLNILFPAACVACDSQIIQGTLCTDCRIKIVPHRTVFCGTCGAPLPGMRNICHPNIPYLLGAAGEYANPSLRALIQALKFERLRGAAKPLADILIHYCARLPIEWRGCTVVPLPISKRRNHERGFNQSALIASHFAQSFGLPLMSHALTRIAHRNPQSEIADRTERWRNITGCFSARKTVPRKIILIDDVTTSGATFTEAVTALRAAGAKKVLALAVAKAR